MRNEGQFESARHERHFKIVGLLKAYTVTKDLGKGSRLHAYIQEHNLLKENAYIGSTLVNMYAKCGALSNAQRVLRELPVRDMVTWSALITGYAQKAQGDEALKCFDKMLLEGHSPDAITFVSVLNACGSIGAVTKGEEIHDRVVSLGMLEKDIVLGNAFVDMYAKCGALPEAHQVLNALPMRNVVTWSALIAGYAQQGQGWKALICFEDMLQEGHFPNAITFISVLRACGSIGAVAKGNEIHDKIASLGMFEKDIMLGTALVDMYAKCGVLAKAQRILEDLPKRNVVTWTSLIAGYAQQGKGEKALKCFDDMLYEGHSPDLVTFVYALKACGIIGAAVKGKEIHDRIVNLGMLEKDILLGTSLVDMYAKCGALGKARQMLEELHVRDVFTWNALIAGYAQQGEGEEALKCFNGMVHEGHSPDVVTFIYILNACGSIGAVTKGEEIHDKIVRLGITGKDIMLGNALMDMYTKCGAVSKAQQVLEELPVRNVVTWSVLIAGCVQQGQGDKALECFNNMLYEGHSPNAVTFVSTLIACGSIQAAVKIAEIHDEITHLGMLEKDIVLRNALADGYAKCGAFAQAQQVVREHPIRDVVTWNVLIAGYAQQGQGEEALKCFNDMLHEGYSPNAVTFACALKACGSIGAAVKGEEIHDKIVGLNILEKDIMLGNSLVDMYAKCGALIKAQRVLEELPIRNVVTWNAIIAGYAQQEQGEEALKCFNDMLHEGQTPDVVTFVSVLTSCGSVGSAVKGEEIHDKIVSFGTLEKDILFGNTLMNMYVKCGALAKAQRLFERLVIQNVVTWCALIAGYAQQGQGEEALKCFDDMLHEGHCPDTVTFVCTLKACGSIGAVAKGEEIHDKIVRLDILGKDIGIGNAVIDMYIKCGAFAKAQQAFKELHVQDVLTWNGLIVGYAQQGQGEKVLECFDDMLHHGHSPDVVTFVCVLKGCGSIGAVSKGEETHKKIVSFGMLETDIVLGNMLVDMYAKCGVLAKAQQVLEELPSWDVVTYNALIAGYAQQGQSLEAISCLERMQANGVKPNSITLTSVLNACSHSGLLYQAETYFWEMSTKYGIYPNLEHSCCMIDLFGRAGKFKKALSVIAEMPSDKWLPSWVALLGAGRKWREVNIARLALQQALHLDKSNAAVHVLMADI